MEISESWISQQRLWDHKSREREKKRIQSCIEQLKLYETYLPTAAVNAKANEKKNVEDKMKQTYCARFMFIHRIIGRENVSVHDRWGSCVSGFSFFSLWLTGLKAPTN